MKNEKIAEDLLNLYTENLLSEDSKQFVEDNLKESEELRRKLKKIKDDSISFDKKEEKSLKFLSKSIKKDKNNYAFMVTALVVSIFLIVFSFLTKPIHYDNDGDLYQVTKTDDKIFISFNKDIIKVDSFIENEEYGNGKKVFLDAYTTRFDEIFNKSSEQTIALEKNLYSNIYYENQDKPASLIYGNNTEEKITILPRLALNIYFYLISIICLVLLFISFIRKNSRRFIKYIIPIPISFLLAQISINGFKFYSFYFQRDLIYVIILWISLYIFIISAIKLVLNKKKNKLDQ